jgi:hypothetical protein
MPYIRQKDRPSVMADGPEGVGELVYQLTQCCLNYLPQTLRFGDYEQVIGALECTKLELYRRRVAGYEDQKCRENGDVY